MPFPKTSDELKAAGYVFENDATCKACGEPIEWYTTPHGRKIPMDPMSKGTDPAITHFSTCSDLFDMF